jgi:hypothetical protein
MPSRSYKNVIFTDHALERLRLRRITQEMIVTAIRQPDQKVLEADGDTKFIKTIGGRNTQVVAAYLADEKKWLVKSSWVRGEDDPKGLLARLLGWLRRLLR